jgi:hypothetical protein
VNKVKGPWITEVEIVKASTLRASALDWRWPRRLALLALAATLVAAGIGHRPASAESSPQFTNVAISVMPEYDQPRVLVSYRGELNADVSLPLQVRLRLPADATIEHICSIKQPGEEHICQPYTADPDGQYLAVSWEAITPIMYVEFYYGSVSGAGQRSLDFDFWPPYPVQNLDMFVLEPAAVTDFTLSPAPADTVEEEGLRHHSYSLQGVSVEEPVTIEMVYTRDTDEPSVPPRMAAAADDNGGIPQSLILALGLAGAVVLAFVLYSAFGRRFRARLVLVSRQSPSDEGAAAQEDTFFCRQCGGKVRQGFAFCPTCGQEVRGPPKEQG